MSQIFNLLINWYTIIIYLYNIIICFMILFCIFVLWFITHEFITHINPINDLLFIHY